MFHHEPYFFGSVQARLAQLFFDPSRVPGPRPPRNPAGSSSVLSGTDTHVEGSAHLGAGSSGLLEVLRHEDVEWRSGPFGFPKDRQFLKHTHWHVGSGSGRRQSDPTDTDRGSLLRELNVDRSTQTAT